MHSIAALCPASAPIPVQQGSKQASRSESNAHHPQCTCAHIRYHSQNALIRRSGLLRCCRMLERPQGNFFCYLTALLRVSKSCCMDPVFRTVVALGVSCRGGAGEGDHLEKKVFEEIKIGRAHQTLAVKVRRRGGWGSNNRGANIWGANIWGAGVTEAGGRSHCHLFSRL